MCCTAEVLRASCAACWPCVRIRCIGTSWAASSVLLVCLFWDLRSQDGKRAVFLHYISPFWPHMNLNRSATYLSRYEDVAKARDNVTRLVYCTTLTIRSCGQSTSGSLLSVYVLCTVSSVVGDRQGNQSSSKTGMQPLDLRDHGGD